MKSVIVQYQTTFSRIGNHVSQSLVTKITNRIGLECERNFFYDTSRSMGKSIWGNRPRVNFVLKKPSEKDGRKTFQILKRTVRQGQAPEHERIDNERLTAINLAFKNGIQDAVACEIQSREVIADLMKIERQKLPRVVHNEENQRLVQAYWDKEYEHRDLVDANAAKNRLIRAAEAVGSLSLFSADRKELQKAVNAKYKDNRQRDVVSALNQLLAFAGRGIELIRREEVSDDVQYLKPSEFEAVQKHVEDPLDRLLQRVAFVTGLRQGEIFALTPESTLGTQFFSQHQIDRQLERRQTKRKMAKKRQIYVLPGGEEPFREWANLPKKTKLAMRNRKHAEVLQRACQKAFPDRDEKHVVFHDLRHSYAIYLVSRGVSLTQVAQCLNNSYAVCERYYSGFVLKDETIENIKRIIEESEART
jgi:integrase